MKRIYLDANATLPCLNLENWAREFHAHGNPSSLHQDGQKAKSVLNTSRDILSAHLSCDPYDLFFTSGATEGLTGLIQGFAQKNPKARFAYLETDHTCVLENMKVLEKMDRSVTKISVSPQGLPTMDSLNWDVMVVTAVNNETGILFPLNDLQKIKNRGIKIILDAVQVPGKIPHDLATQYYQLADAIVISGHKVGALSGVGVVVNKDLDLLPLIYGGKQERNRRGGTENLFGIFTLQKAFENLPSFDSELKNYFENRLKQEFPQVMIHGEGVHRNNNTVNFHIPGMKSSVLIFLDSSGYSLSLGSACASGAIGKSHVIFALTQSENIASASLRLSITPETERNFVEPFLSTLKNYLQT